MRLEKVEALIFDLDETLIDAQQGLAAAHDHVTAVLQEFLAQRKVQIKMRELRETIERFDDEMNRELKYNRDSWWQEFVGRIAPRVKLPNGMISQLTDAYWMAYEEAAVPYPDTFETLLYLSKKDYSLGLVSDTDGEIGRKAGRISRLQFSEIFDVCVIGGDETTELKSTGLPFLLAADRLSISPKACVVIGDKPFTDIAGGKLAGMRTILVVRRRWETDIESDYEVTSLTEIRTLL